MCVFGVSKTKFLQFDPISPKTADLGLIFDGTNFRLKKALTIATLTYELPIIVIVVP